MRIRVLTIFPELFAPFLSTSLVGRAIDRGRLEIGVHDLRDYTEDRHRSVDDEPYGGGGGMVMTAPPFLRAVEQLAPAGGAWRILLSPQGEPLSEPGVRELARRGDLILLCGRYEGVDERIRQTVVDQEISIGDYVLSGGELPAMVVIEAVSRQIPGVVGLPSSVELDSFRHGLLDYPHYTRPRSVAGLEVPEVLLGGNHAEIEAWRRRQSLRATVVKRPDLLAAVDFTPGEWREAAAIAAEHGVKLPADLQAGK
jgi:tRNA (guanine37-N1)-methyltransferase